MTTSNIRRPIVRLAATVAVMASLAMSSGIAAADCLEVGLNECDLGGCSVVTMDDLREARAERDIAVYRQAKFPTDRYTPHFVP